MKIEIERAVIEDVEAIARIANENLKEVNSRYHSKEVMDMSYNECSVSAFTKQLYWKEIFVAKVDSDIVGTAALANFGRDGSIRWCLSNVFVSIRHHGKGIGTQLVNKVIERAQDNCSNQIEVPSSRNAVGFYEKCGFRKSELPEEDELTWMIKRLKPVG